MLNKRVSELIKQQVTKEVYSSYLYLDFSNYFHKKGLHGFGHWYDIQAKEELDHAKLFIKYLKNNEEDLDLDSPDPIEKPHAELTSDLDTIKRGLEHEKYVTSLIAAIYNTAAMVHDSKTMEFLKWFMDEQREEEENAEDLIEKYENCDDSRKLHELDEELSIREYKAPSLVI